jgi:hypothetical protein
VTQLHEQGVACRRRLVGRAKVAARGVGVEIRKRPGQLRVQWLVHEAPVVAVDVRDDPQGLFAANPGPHPLPVLAFIQPVRSLRWDTNDERGPLGEPVHPVRVPEMATAGDGVLDEAVVFLPFPARVVPCNGPLPPNLLVAGSQQTHMRVQQAAGMLEAGTAAVGRQFGVKWQHVYAFRNVCLLKRGSVCSNIAM